MKKNTTLILSTVLVGAGAYIIYSRNRKKANSTNVEDIEARQKEQAEQQAKAIARENAKYQYNSFDNPYSYKSKVARVQGFLGVAIDGIVGPQTLGALRQKFPQFQTMNSTNIDAITAAIFGSQNLQFFN